METLKYTLRIATVANGLGSENYVPQSKDSLGIWKNIVGNEAGDLILSSSKALFCDSEDEAKSYLKEWKKYNEPVKEPIYKYFE